MDHDHPGAVSSSRPPAALPEAAPAAVHDAAGADPFEAPVVGVGPWEGPWPDGDRYDRALLAEGDRRNVIDRYRYWKRSAIRADLARRAHPFQVAVENWEHDFNIGAIVRTANAFGAGGVHIVGKRRWNRRGAMVTDRYLNVAHHADVAGLADWAAREGLALIAIDNLPGARPLESAQLPERSLLLFGQEGPGLSAEAVALAEAVYEITQYGSTRSINAGAAAAIAMYHWALQHAAGRAAGSAEGGTTASGSAAGETTTASGTAASGEAAALDGGAEGGTTASGEAAAPGGAAAAGGAQPSMGT